jgi:pilus assembly protein Flp/PilA
MVKRVLLLRAQLANWLHGKFASRGDVGASLVEYVLLLTLIAVAAIGALTFLGGSITNTLNHVANQITNTTSS